MAAPLVTTNPASAPFVAKLLDRAGIPGGARQTAMTRLTNVGNPFVDVELAPRHESAQVLVDLKRVEPRMMQAINGAKQVINVEMFNFAADGSGRRVSDALIRKAKEGVEVNVIMDRTSLLGFPPGSVNLMMGRLRDAGARVVMSNPLSSVDARRHVDHRKVVEVDGQIAFAGGINLGRITDSYHDTMLELHGPGAALVAKDQLQRWQEVGEQPSRRHTQAVSDALRGTRALEPGVSPVQVLRNSPHEKTSAASDFYLQAIRSAKERLWVVSPAFSDLDMVDEIAAAARRGVDVRIVASGKPPLMLPLIKWDTRAAMRRIIDAGGTVVETPDVSHTKAIVSDDTIGIGTVNVTKRSVDHDHEMLLVSKDPALTAQVGAVFTGNFGRSTKLTREQTLEGVGQKLANWLVDDRGFQY